MKPVKIPETRFPACGVRRAQMPGGSRFSIRRCQRAVKRVLNRFNRVSFWNQVTAGNPFFCIGGKRRLESHPSRNPDNSYLWLMLTRH
jgi:hypothetical protein